MVIRHIGFFYALMVNRHRVFRSRIAICGQIAYVLIDSVY